MMIDLASITRVYFLGAGGIGMSALARYFNALGNKVAGYDKTPTALTSQLIKEGIDIHFDDAVKSIPDPYRLREGTLVVYTPAVPGDHNEMKYFRRNGFELLKRAEVLGLITRNKKTIAIAGTHGKTTVTTMISWIMSHTQLSCSAFLGGISKNFDNNLVLNRQSEWVIAEADEYDRSFLHLRPYAALITSMDADHLDIYGNIDALHGSFNTFAAQVNQSGFIVMKKGLPIDESLLKCRIFTYSVKERADFTASGIQLKNTVYTFNVETPNGVIGSITLQHPGLLNVENAVGAVALTHLLGCDGKIIRESLATFTGNQRRFDYILKSERIVYIDDYAHHPEEIEATLLSIRELFPGKKITGVFQPHLFTRTRDLASQFGRSLSLLDDLILLEIYPAREEPIEGISSESILRHVTIENKMICRKSELLTILKSRKIEVLVTMGAGDIDRFIEPIKKTLS